MNAADIESIRKKIVVVYSAGCGNGKSEIAANLAFCIAREGVRTWILDANTFSPAQDIILGFKVTGPTFSDFLVKPDLQELPVYPLNRLYNNPRPLDLFFTPSERNNEITRFDLQESINSGRDLCTRLPLAILKAMDEHKIDLLIVDTHPGFERINEVWMGITQHLLLISRINPVDFENLKSLLKDTSVQDIAQKLVVFTNVQTDKSRRVSPDMENTAVLTHLGRLKKQLEQDPCLFGCNGILPEPTNPVRIWENAFLYSEKLALFQQKTKRKGIFVEKEPEDVFSRNIEKLAAYFAKDKSQIF